MAKTLLLDRTAWDLVLDAQGNIALASEPYAIAQDVASVVKTELGECWYDTTVGIPYVEDILGKYPPTNLLQSKLEAAALTVPKVVQAKCELTSFQNRKLSGQLLVVDTDGQESGIVL